MQWIYFNRLIFISRVQLWLWNLSRSCHRIVRQVMLGVSLYNWSLARSVGTTCIIGCVRSRFLGLWFHWSFSCCGSVEIERSFISFFSCHLCQKPPIFENVLVDSFSADFAVTSAENVSRAIPCSLGLLRGVLSKVCFSWSYSGSFMSEYLSWLCQSRCQVENPWDSMDLSCVFRPCLADVRHTARRIHDKKWRWKTCLLICLMGRAFVPG